jgi:hypothetical protein
MLWKEWRESWWLLIATTLVSVIMPAVLCAWENLPDWMVPVGLLTCLLPGLLGARLFAAETVRGTAFFQLERPVERRMLWKVRVLLPLLVMAVNVAVAAGFFVMFRVWETILAPLLFLFTGAALLIFSASLLCSILMDRPVTALAAGGVVAFAALMGIIVLLRLLAELGVKLDFWDATTTKEFTVFSIFTACMTVTAIGLLFLGRWTYIRQERK